VRQFDAEWQARFERFARTYADEARISGWSHAGLERRLRVVRALLAGMALPGSPRALDLGCGAGSYVRLSADLGHQAFGLDYSLPTLARALAADPGSKGRYAAGSAYALPFRPRTFDLVLSIGVLQALAEPELALDEMTRVLRPGGWLLIEALNGRAWLARGQRALKRVRGTTVRVRTYDPAGVRVWLSARGFCLVRQEGLLLPPRRVPGIATVLDLPIVARTLGTSRRVVDAVAHTFLFVARMSTGVADAA
jgi:SAM-dependent methyltransferase